MHADEGATEGILPGPDQDYIGSGPEECAKGRGVLLRYGCDDSHSEPVAWSFCWRRRDGVNLAGGEG